MMFDLSLLGTAPIFNLFICFCAVMAVAISKAGFGGSMGALAAPIMLFAFAPTTALGILLPVFVLIDIWLVWQWRKVGIRHLIIWMIIAGTIGQIIGWLLLSLGNFDDDLLLLFIGLIAFVTGARYFWQMLMRRPSAIHFRASIRAIRKRYKKRALIWCSLSGFTSFVSLTGGIPVQIYMLPMRLPRQLFIGTMAWYFLFLNAFKIPFFVELEFITTQTMMVTALITLFVPLGVIIGRYLNKVISDSLFYNVAYSALVILGLRLVAQFFNGA